MFEAQRSRHFPTEIVPGISARAVDAEAIREVWRALSARVETPFVDLGNYEMPAARRARASVLERVHARTHAEHFAFYDAGGGVVGWSSGEMIDPSTFFMAYSAVLPEFRRRGIYGGFLRVFLPYLHAIGYERVTSHHMVNNRAILIAKLKAGFFVTGVILDERFGAQVSLAHLLHDDRRTGFARAFSLEDYSSVPDYRRGVPEAD